MAAVAAHASTAVCAPRALACPSVASRNVVGQKAQLGMPLRATQCPTLRVSGRPLGVKAVATEVSGEEKISLPGWNSLQHSGKEQRSVRSFRRVLLGRQQQLRRRRRRRPRARPDTEADSLDDLDLDDLDNEELDDLFENYGEVVRAESAPTPNSSEVDDDAESLALAVALAEVANEVKASEIRVLCVKPLVYWTRFFVIATGFSRPQVDAISQRMRNMAEERFKRTSRGDLKPNSWTLLDFGDVVVHIFYPQERSFYNLEEFYGNAISVELPFESQSQVR